MLNTACLGEMGERQLSRKDGSRYCRDTYRWIAFPCPHIIVKSRSPQEADSRQLRGQYRELLTDAIRMLNPRPARHAPRTPQPDNLHTLFDKGYRAQAMIMNS